MICLFSSLSLSSFSFLLPPPLSPSVPQTQGKLIDIYTITFHIMPIPPAPILTTTSQPVINGEVNAQGGISCDVLYTSRPPSWYFNNVPLSTNGQYTISENKLLIRNATMNNSGSYTCRASNEYGTSVRHFLLIIGSKEEEEGGREERQRNGREEEREGERERASGSTEEVGTSPTLILHNHLLYHEHNKHQLHTALQERQEQLL